MSIFARVWPLPARTLATVSLVALLGLCLQPSFAGDELSVNAEVDRLEEALLIGDKTEDDADAYYRDLTQLVYLRMRQFELMLGTARSRNDAADAHLEALAEEFPEADPALFPLPESVTTVRQAHENLQALYDQRIRLLELISDEFYLEITGNGTRGTRALLLELRLIGLELRYQALRLPDIANQIRTLITFAPLPLFWFVVKVIVSISVFRWWRRWFPETLKRMQSYLLAIRPRNTSIMNRVRLLWYIDQVRSPLEWLVLLTVLLHLTSFLELTFVSSVGEIIVRWLCLAVFSVALANALAARGSGGLTGSEARTRLISLRLLAAWIVLFGLGLNLAEFLMGDGAVYAAVEQLFEWLLIPLVLAQLGLWRTYLFARLTRLDPDKVSKEAFDAQRGLGKLVGAAKIAGYLFAAWLRRILLKRLERFNPGSAATAAAAEPEDEQQRISAELHESLVSGAVDYTKYGRQERRELVAKIDSGLGGTVVVIGERGIGKEGFIKQAAEAVEGEYIELNCEKSDARRLEVQLAAALGLEAPLEDPTAIAAAIEERNIRVVCIASLHRLVRPVIGGMQELSTMNSILARLPEHVVQIASVDRYAWQYMRCALAEQADSVQPIVLPSWTEEQIVELLEARCAAAEIEPDCTGLRVPTQYLDASLESSQAIKFNGILVMAATLSGGNPSIAGRLFAEALRLNAAGDVVATLPANARAEELEDAPIFVLLVLRAIAQTEYVSRETLQANLQYSPAVIENALNLALARGWIKEKENLYTLTWPWFRTVTGVLARQNLLAGVRWVEA